MIKTTIIWSGTYYWNVCPCFMALHHVEAPKQKSNITGGTASVKINLQGSTYDNDSEVKPSASADHKNTTVLPDTQVQEIPFSDRYSLLATLQKILQHRLPIFKLLPEG